MKKLCMLLNLLIGLFWLASSCSDTSTTAETMSVEERMAKARAAKAEKKADRATGKLDENRNRLERATAADYNAPVDKVLKGPNGEVVHTGERGAKFYINKNGNKTYLSSNQ